MADYTVTAADVRPLPGAEIQRFDAGEALAVGDAVFVAADGDVEKADASITGEQFAVGIVVSAPNGALSASAGDAVDVCVGGRVTGFSGMTEGLAYVSDAAAGAVADSAPAGASGNFKWIIGIAISQTDLLVNPFTDDLAAQ